MNVGRAVEALDAIAPLAYAEPWDNVGLLVGDRAQPLTRALLAIDCTREVVVEAAQAGCELVVAYHPPIFGGLKRVTAGSVPFELARRNVAAFSPHTALDAAPGGTNDVLADVIAMRDRRPIRPSAPADGAVKLVTFVPEADVEAVSDALFGAGAGQIGKYRSCSFRSRGTGTFFGEEGAAPVVGSAGRLETVDEVRVETIAPIGRVAAVVAALRAAHPYETPAFDLVRLATAPDGHGMGRIGVVSSDRANLIEGVKRGLGVAHLLVAGPASGKVARAAVCAGAAGDLLGEAIRQGAELVVTGEVRHHDALAAAAAGVTVVCALHSNSERIALRSLAARLEAALPGLGVQISVSDRDPFSIV